VPYSPYGKGSVWEFGPFGPDQLAWLEADLLEANAMRSYRPWIVVAGHRPIYTTTQLDAQGNPEGWWLMTDDMI